MTESKQVFKYGSLIEKSIRPLGVVAQFWLEHRPVTPEVASSSLVYPAKKPSRKRGLFVFAVRKQLYPIVAIGRHHFNSFLQKCLY